MVTLKAEPYQFEELKNGNPLQLRTTVAYNTSRSIKKGDTVSIVSASTTLEATIISEPIIVIDREEKGETELSLEVSTTDETIS